MSQQYGRIDSALVVHHHFRSLTIEAKLLCLFLRATPRGNAIGCFYYPASQIADDLGDQLTVEQARAALDELAARSYAKYCQITRWVWIPKHLDHFPVRGRNSGTHALDVLETVPRDFSYSAELIEAFERNHDWSTDRDAASLDRRWKGLLATFEGASKPLPGGGEAPSKPLRSPFEHPPEGVSRACAHDAAARGELDPSPVETESSQETPAAAAVDGEGDGDGFERVPDVAAFAEILEWGVQHVAERGPLSRHTAQTFIAGMCKLYGDANVARQLLVLKLSPKVEPRSWLKSQLSKDQPDGNHSGGNRRSVVDAVREANRAAINGH